MELNKSQKAAVENIDSNLVINAGAGTGKTFVLVRRYLELLNRGDLKENREIESIVAITFTRKAAEEMLERVREGLGKKWDHGEKWKRYYREINRANISTIHGFCGKILRESAIEAGIDPHFEILDDRQSSAYLESTIVETINRALEEPAYYEVFKELEIENIYSISSDFKKLYNSVMTYGRSFKELKEELKDKFSKIEGLDLDQVVEIWELTEEIIKHDLVTKRSGITKLTDSPAYLSLEDPKNLSLESIREGLLEIESRIGTSRHTEVQNLYNQLGEKISNLLITYELEAYGNYSLILGLLERIHRDYGDFKLKNGYLDYDDMQIKVDQLFNNKEILRKYQNRFRYIMIDECQDTNELQKRIFYKLATRDRLLDRNNLFIVGDPKQSIYNFRGADLEVFFQMEKDIRAIDRANLIYLDENYRTRSDLMDNINSLFKSILEKIYSPLVGKLEAGGKNPVNIEIIRNEEVEIPSGYSKTEFNREYEREVIARRIMDLVEEGTYKYRDFGLLLKSTTDVELYEEIFRKYKIPYYNSSGRGFFQCREILDLKNGVKAIFNLSDYLSNIGFLRSAMIGFTDSLIYRLMEKPGHILERLYLTREDKLLASEIGLINKTIEIYEALLEILERNGYRALGEAILDKTSYRLVATAMDDPLQRLGNLEKYLDFLGEYDSLGFEEGLDLIEYLDLIENPREPQVNVDSEKSDSVKILTIHKSKGLEFPVVIIPDLSRGQNTDSSKLIYHKNLGLGVKLKDSQRLYDQIRAEISREEDQEEKRLLYVAITRAKELIILGGQNTTKAGFYKILEGPIEKLDYKILGDIKAQEDMDKARPDFYKFLELEESEEKFRNLFTISDSLKNRPGYISISQYLTFKECEKKYYFKYEENISGNDFKLLDDLKIGTDPRENIGREDLVLGPIDKGNIIHSFAENYEADIDSTSLLKDIVRTFGHDYDKVSPYLKKPIGNFIAEYEENIGEKTKIFKEFEIRYLEASSKFFGIVDRIDLIGDRLYIVDYKTGKYRQEYLESYAFQLQFYGYILNKIFKKEIGSLKILYLEENKSVEVDKSMEKLEEVFKELYEFSLDLEKKLGPKDYLEKGDCEVCPYERICK